MPQKRFRAGAVGFGLMVFALGCCEYSQSSTASSHLVAADLATLERGEPPPNLHISLGEHVAVFYESLTARPRSTFGVIEHLSYSVISLEHPTIRLL